MTSKPTRVSSSLIGYPIHSVLCHIEAKSFINYYIYIESEREREREKEKESVRERHTYIHTYICIHVYTYIFVCIYIPVFICLCLYIYMLVIMYTFISERNSSWQVLIFLPQTISCVDSVSFIQEMIMASHINTLSCPCTHTHTYTHTHTHTCTHRRMQTFTSSLLSDDILLLFWPLSIPNPYFLSVCMSNMYSKEALEVKNTILLWDSNHLYMNPLTIHCYSAIFLGSIWG